MVYIRPRAAPFRARRETTEKREVERMTQKEKKKKARYGVGGNVIYMFALAFRQCRQVPLILLCQVLLGVGENLLGLLVAPVLLGELEAAVPAGALVRSILLFSLGLIAFSAAARYLRTAALYGRVEVRSWLSNAINMKILRTSFPNSLKADFREMYAGASEATSANDRGPEAVWDTLCQLALSVIGLALYLLLLTAMSPVVLLAAAAAAGLSFLTARYLNNWAYAHRAEVEYMEDGIVQRTGVDVLVARHIVANGLSCREHLPVLITRFFIPAMAEGGQSSFYKYAMRSTIDFPLINFALCCGDGGVRLVAGAVAPQPVVLEETAKCIDTGALAEEVCASAEKELRKLALPIKEACISPTIKRQLYRQVVMLLSSNG